MKKRCINPRSLENLNLGAKARYKGKIRRNTTLLPETIQWLEERGNASEMIDLLVASAKNGSLKFNPDISNNAYVSNGQPTSNDMHNPNEIKQLESQMAALRETHVDLIQENARLHSQLDDQASKAKEAQRELEELRSQICEKVNQHQPDLEAGRDRFLACLGLGKQAPEYKRTKIMLNRFLEYILG